MVKILLANNADVNIQDEDGLVAFDYAKMCEHEDVILFLDDYINSKAAIR